MIKQFLHFQTFLLCFLITTSALAQNNSVQSDSLSSIHSTSATSCITCHSDDEPHESIFGQDCSLCHSTESWDQLGIDHGLFQFPLIGLHTEVDCVSCHSEAPGNVRTRSCRDCHLEDEPHEQLLGQDCVRCHNPNGWEHWRFDHTINTSFPLQGTHFNLECTACHTAPVSMKFDVPQNCVDCHRKDDQHRGNFGYNCERCHQPTAFKDVKITY
jgi:hypothetical protein